MTIILLLVGLGLIVLGADWLVDGASGIGNQPDGCTQRTGSTRTGEYTGVERIQYTFDSWGIGLGYSAFISISKYGGCLCSAS